MPDAREPDLIDHVKGGVPPATLNVEGGYATFTVPSGSGGTVMGPKLGGFTTCKESVVVELATDLVSVTETTKGKTPAVDGVPLNTPVAGSRVRPGSSAPDEIVQR
jgi:hypothetical protein